MNSKKTYLNYIIIIIIFSFSKTFGQTEVKVNTLLAPLGIVNIAVEKPIGKKTALLGNIMISPWKSFTGRHLQIYMGDIEFRYYFNENHSKWFIGGYAGSSVFNMQKWNYWNSKVILDEDGKIIYNEDGTKRITTLYQKGFNVFIGASGGYKFIINEHWTMDLFLSIANSQGFYKGYFEDDGKRYDKAINWNKSGEFIPTKAGLTLNYRF